MINPSKTFRKILREWGHDVYIQRILNNGNHSKNLERVTTRQVGQSGIVNTNSMNQLDEGIQIAYDAVYYFEADISPKEGDRIYEDISGKSHRDFTMYAIQAVTPVRGRQGKVLYWIVGASREK